MSAPNNDNYDFGSVDLIIFALKKWKTLGLVSVAAFIASVIISFMITPTFKSTVVLFPTSSISVAKSLISYSSYEKGDVMSFGEEEEAERLLQILNSEVIKTAVVEKFNLMEHYEIPSDDKYKYTKLNEKYESNVNSRRTEFMSIEVSVLDEDPVVAADMANFIADMIDTTVHRMQQERAAEAFKLVENEYFSLQAELKAKKDSLAKIRDKGVIDYESQAEVINNAYALAIMNGNMAGAAHLQKKLDILAKYGGEYVALRDYLEFTTEQLTRLRTKYSEAKVMVEQKLPNKFIVDRAFPAEKKAKPKKSIIVMVSTFTTFFLTLLLLLVVESIKKRQEGK